MKSNEMKKNIFITRCVFNGFQTATLDIGDFSNELKTLMKKYHIKSICPTHLPNAQISRHITDDGLHITGIYFQAG